MTQKLILTDTDIISSSKLTEAEYQLVYGILNICQDCTDDWQDAIYNKVAYVLEPYAEPILKMSKVIAFKNLLDDIQDNIQSQMKKFKNPPTDFYIPFFDGKMYDIVHLKDGLSFALLVLSTIEKDITASLPLHESIKTFPLPSLSELMRELLDYYYGLYEASQADPNLGEYFWSRYSAIGWELFDRGLWNYDEMPDDLYYGTYKQLIVNRYKIEHPTPEKAAEEVADAKALSAKLRTGVLRYMLESLGVKDSEDARKVIHFALRHGKDAYNIKTNSNDTTYSYLHNDKQLAKISNDIENILEEYQVKVPEGLKRLHKVEL